MHILRYTNVKSCIWRNGSFGNIGTRLSTDDKLGVDLTWTPFSRPFQTRRDWVTCQPEMLISMYSGQQDIFTKKKTSLIRLRENSRSSSRWLYLATHGRRLHHPHLNGINNGFGLRTRVTFSSSDIFFFRRKGGGDRMTRLSVYDNDAAMLFMNKNRMVRKCDNRTKINVTIEIFFLKKRRILKERNKKQTKPERVVLNFWI